MTRGHINVAVVTAVACVLLSAMQHTTTEAFPFGMRSSSSQGDDPYSVLGVSKRASASDIKKAFRKKTRDSHPDLKETAEEKERAKEEMAKILRAYEILTDEEKRQHYDRYGVVPGENGVPPSSRGGGHAQHGGVPPGFEFFFQGGGGPFGFQRPQAEPIKSKTPSFSTVSEYERAAARVGKGGHSILLVQAYHDACFECRMFSGAWESLANSGWAYGAVAMYRVAVDQGEGMSILAAAGVSYGPAPVVFAVVGGVVLPLAQLPGVLYRERQQFMQPMLFDFVASLFTDTPLFHQTSIVDIEEVARRVVTQSPMFKYPTAVQYVVMLSERVDRPLVMSINAIGGAHIVCELVSHSALVKLIRTTCKMSLDRTVHDVMVAIPAAALALDVSGAIGSSPWASTWCPAVMVATSQSPFSPSKAVQFVERLHQVSLSGVHGERRATSVLTHSSVDRVCTQRCVVLLLATCSGVPQDGDKKTTRPFLSPSDALMHTVNQPAKFAQYRPSDILEDISPFQATFVCLDVEPILASTLERDVGSLTRLDRGLLVVKRSQKERGSNGDSFVFVPEDMHAEQNKRELFTDLHSFLADVVEERAEILRHFNVLSSTSLLEDVLTPQSPLPVAWWRPYYWKVSSVMDSLSGLLSLLPLAAFWFLVKWISPKTPVPPQPAAAGPPPPQAPHRPGREDGAPSPQRSSTGAPPSSPPRPPPPSPPRSEVSNPYRVPFLCSDDIREAERGKGFLIIIFDKAIEDRKYTVMPLPILLTNDARFTARVVDVHHKRWWQWLDALLASSQQPLPYDVSVHGAVFVAIRKTRMLACVKSAHTPTSTWIAELLDGSCSTTLTLPGQ